MPDVRVFRCVKPDEEQAHKPRWSRPPRRPAERADGSLYAVYRGDELLAFGTAAECARLLGVRERTVRWLACPFAHRRAAENLRYMVAERVEVDE